MVEYSLASTIQRRIGTLRRVVELTAVLFLVVIGTVINLSFGWVALFFTASAAGDRSRNKSVVFPAAVETSKEF